MINLSSEKKLIFSDEKEFDYDYVYPDNVSNTDIFNKSIQDNIIKSLDGYNLSIMAYGQTVINLFLFYKLFLYFIWKNIRAQEKLIRWVLIIE